MCISTKVKNKCNKSKLENNKIEGNKNKAKHRKLNDAISSVPVLIYGNVFTCTAVKIKCNWFQLQTLNPKQAKHRREQIIYLFLEKHM